MSGDSTASVVFSIDDEGIAWIRFNRPEALNAISVVLAEEQMLSAVQQVQAASGLRAVVLAGSGRPVMAGAICRPSVLPQPRQSAPCAP